MKQLERIIADTDALPAEKREEAACKLHEKPALRKWMRLTVGGKLRDGAERVPRHGTRPARDRAHALIDPDTGKVASAKQPRKWGEAVRVRLGLCRAARERRFAAGPHNIPGRDAGHQRRPGSRRAAVARAGAQGDLHGGRFLDAQP